MPFIAAKLWLFSIIFIMRIDRQITELMERNRTLEEKLERNNKKIVELELAKRKDENIEVIEEKKAMKKTTEMIEKASTESIVFIL